MNIALGIDTGGTYTDAVLVDQAHSAVIASAKALTTHHDLTIGIRAALAAIFEGDKGPARPHDITMVSLSTTLATNAIVEGHSSPVCLLLIGYDPELLRRFGLDAELVTNNVVHIRGGHDGFGNEVAPLDEEALRAAVIAYRHRVEAFAVSGYFSVRNPEHELRAKAIVEESVRHADGAALPVTCGHDLTDRLNSVRRATTSALNAGLIPLLRELIDTVRQSMAELGISAPLMVVKGDGSLVRAEWAMQRPIETILSGPAASVVGASHLAGARDMWVVDMGGTTTDIAVLTEGRPRLNPAGARVGRWQTMVEAIDVHTVGLGGDSQVVWNDEMGGTGEGSLSKALQIGPRRLIPLSLLAMQFPAIVDDLEWQASHPRLSRFSGRFLVAQGRIDRALSADEQQLLDQLGDQPQALTRLARDAVSGHWLMHGVERLIRRRLVQEAGFTPTDALHALGSLAQWHIDAARLGADLLAARAGVATDEFCGAVVRQASDNVATALVTKALADENVAVDWARDKAAQALLHRALGGGGVDLDCRLILRRPVVGIGAPVEAYLPRTARQLHTELIIPTHAGVANAVGAVVGSVFQQARAQVQLLDAPYPVYRASLPDGIIEDRSLEACVARSSAILRERAVHMARQAGAAHIEVHVVREDKIVAVRGDPNEVIFLGSELTATAVGRPAAAGSVGE